KPKSDLSGPPVREGKQATTSLPTGRVNWLYSDLNTGGTMGYRILHLMCLITCFVVLMTSAHAQQSHWAAPDDKTVKFMIDMERKWAEGVCGNNGVISELLADDFQGTSTQGERFNKDDELRDEKGPRSSHGCALDDAKVHFFGENVAIVYGSEHAIGKDKTDRKS